jgi:hypothetical protein
VLEGERLGRARSLALAGPPAVVDELHPNVRWRPPVLEVQKRRKTHDLQLEGRPLVLVPLVFARPVLAANQEAERAIGIGNQGRGTAAFWAPEDDGARSASSSCSATAARPCCAGWAGSPPPPSSRRGWARR